MKVVVLAEAAKGERRVAITPDVVPLLTRAGLDVVVQRGAGLPALITDAALTEAGATVADGMEAADLDVVLHVRPLSPRLVSRLPAGCITVGFCSPATELETVAALRDAHITSFAVELIPRISRAQSMDALTSQALVGGYRAVLEAAIRLPRFFPLFMTAAGTVPPAKVLVLGAGVAGLQAIATARRLGAVVSAYDVRSSSAEEVASMGATFVRLELDSLEGTGGYAREMTEERAARQRELLTPFVSESDVVITTAAVPGRRAPLLVTADMLRGLRPGSVVVDLAAESGGNVEGSLPGQDLVIELDGGGRATLVGLADVPSTMPVDASRLYAKNLVNLLLLMAKDGQIVPDFDDEVVAGACLTHAGVVRHEPTAAALQQVPAEPAPVVPAESEAESEAEPDAGPVPDPVPDVEPEVAPQVAPEAAPEPVPDVVPEAAAEPVAPQERAADEPAEGDQA